MPARNETRTEAVIDATEEAVRASIEAAEKVARASLGASTEAARTVQESLRHALDALGSERQQTTTRKSA